MLDEFSTVKLEDGANKPTESSSAGPSTSTPKPGDTAPKESPAAGEEPFSEEDFAKQLQAGMADLLGELEQSVCCYSHIHVGHYHELIHF